MHAGKTYSFHLALTNPLYDPIQVKLSVQRVHVASFPGSTTAVTSPTTPTASISTQAQSLPSAPEKGRRPPFAVSLPTSVFSVAAFVEAWEYDEEEDMFADDDALGIGTRPGGRGAPDRESKPKSKTVGVLERKANMTLVGGEVVIGKEARGNVKFNMLVTYTYRSDDAGPSESTGVIAGSPTKSGPSKHLLQPEVKSFSFYTVVDLGPIIPKPDPKPDPFDA